VERIYQAGTALSILLIFAPWWTRPLWWFSEYLGHAELRWEPQALASALNSCAHGISTVMTVVLSTIYLGAISGMPLATIFVILWWFERANPRPSGLLALIIALSVNILQVVYAAQFFWVPAGASIRPMGWALLSAIIGGCALIAATLLSVHSVLRQRRVLFALLAIPLAIESLYLGRELLLLAARVKGFEIAD
jgi:hypothetical protein